MELTIRQAMESALAHHRANRIDQAEQAYRLILNAFPNEPDALEMLGALLSQRGRHDEGLALIDRALALRPDAADYHANRGLILSNISRDDEAVAAYRAALALRPDSPIALYNLGNSLLRLDQDDEAMDCYKRALVLAPNEPNIHCSLGNMFLKKDRMEDAIAAFRRALELSPEYAEAMSNLGNALQRHGDADEAIAVYRRALSIKPTLIPALINMGHALKSIGELDEAIACYDRVLTIAPGWNVAYSDRIYTMHFHPEYDSAAIHAELRRWNDRYAKPLSAEARPHGNDRSSDRRLRIGYVSPDFRQHVVGQNIFPLLSQHDHERFEICCYSSVARPDAFTEVLRPHADLWRNVASRTDEDLARIIREDQIDILIDLSLHMAHNRLLVFARKPAPVQVTYLGYCASTGLEAMDYRLSDPYLDPSDSDLSLYSERTIRLPETYWCYGPGGPTPDPSPPPAATAGYITFGCLNNFAKASWTALDLWAQVLQAVPNSRMIIHSYQGSHLEEVRERFAGHGVAGDRLEFIAKQPWSQYVGTYGRIDIALDPLPWGGGITTCDALWMGVPVVSLAGDTAVGRGGKSILSNLGLGELAVRRPRQYVQAAAALAESPARLAELRVTLRQRMLTSPLMNARRFARHVENAYREMWRQWCGSP